MSDLKGIQEKDMEVLESELCGWECDMPAYDGFVKGFLSTRAKPGVKPTIEIARRFRTSWPTPRDSSTGGDRNAIRVGVLDSSFNPPHYCHGAYLECLAVQKVVSAKNSSSGSAAEPRLLGIDAFLLLLGSTNADKPLSGSSLEQRMRMVDMLATTISRDFTPDTWHVWENKEEFEASNLDNMAIGMVNCSKFVDKCQAVKEAIQSALTTDIEVLCYFTMGWDTIIRFFDPKYYKNFPQELDEFFGNGGRIAYSRRVGFSDKDVEAFFSQPMMDRYNQYIYEITLPKRVKHISSSGVREAIRNGAQFVDDVPPRILGFVNDQMLYRE